MHSKNFPNLFWRKKLVKLHGWSENFEDQPFGNCSTWVKSLTRPRFKSQHVWKKKLVKLHCYKSLLLSKKGATGSFWIFVSRQNLDKIFNIKERIGGSNVWRQFEDNWTIELVRLLIIYMSAIRYLLHKWNQFLFLLYLCWINLWFCRIKFVRLFYLQ